MNNFAIKLVMRGAGMGLSHIFKPAHSAVFSQIFSSSPLIDERVSYEHGNLTESKALSAAGEYSESQISHGEKPSTPSIPLSSSPKSNVLDITEQSKLINTKPDGSDHSKYIPELYIGADLAEFNKDSQSLSESRFPPIPRSNDLQSKSEGKKIEGIVVGRNDIGPNTTSHNGTQNRNIDLIIRPDNPQFKTLEPPTRTSDIKIGANHSHKMARVFPDISEVFEHKTPKKDLAPYELKNAPEDKISNPSSEGLPLIMPRFPMEASLSDPPHDSLKGPGLNEERPVQIRIGTIEVRAIIPPANPSLPPISWPKGFDEFYMARNYFNL